MGETLNHGKSYWRIFAGLVTMTFGVTLAMVVGYCLDDTARAVLTGAAGGMGVTIGVSLLVVARRRREYPLLIVVAPLDRTPVRTLPVINELTVEVWPGLDDDDGPRLHLRGVTEDVVVIWPEEVEPLITALTEALAVVPGGANTEFEQGERR